jgi:putative hemolysin
MFVDFGLILFLILLNGVFAMSEMALVSARAVRLRQWADGGDEGAARALELAEQPTRFLSTVQVGITSIGILSGALGENAIAKPLTPLLESFPFAAPYAKEIALAATVALITYISLIVGELVPKRLALTFPERIAARIAKPMHGLSSASLPFVKILGLSTDIALWLLRIKPHAGPSLTEEEIKILLEQGAKEGVFEETEHQFMENILRLDDRKIGAIMTPRKRIVWLDLQNSEEENRKRILDHDHKILPLCDAGLEQIVGFVRMKDLLDRALLGEPPDLRLAATNALFVPASLSLMELLEQFRGAHLHTALVVDEYGEIEGLATLTDVLEAIVGDMPIGGIEDEQELVRREDGSWLVDGMLDIDRLKEHFALEKLPDEGKIAFNTVGGFVMMRLRRVPKTADFFEYEGLRIEVVDMDGHRVDKVLISKIASQASSTA